MPVLLAEDEEHDVFLMERAFRLSEIANPLVAVSDGQEAIWYLEGSGRYSDRSRFPRPCLLLLDLKMPMIDGFDVLKWIQAQPALRENLPIMVLSSSDHESDVRKAFELGAIDYLVKPMDFNGLLGLVRDLKRSWLEPMLRGVQPDKAKSLQHRR